MNGILSKLNHLFEEMPDYLRKHRIWVWGGFIILTVFLVLGIPRIRIDMSLESFFSQDDPVKVLYDNFRDIFGSDDSVYIVYRAKDGDIFSDESLSALQDIQNELLEAAYEEGKKLSIMERIQEVRTIINVSYLEVQGDTLLSRDFIGEELPKSAAEREELRKRALNHKDYPLFYLSKDSKYGGIWIRTDFGMVLDSEESFSDSDFATDEDMNKGGGSQTKPRYKTTTMLEYADFIRGISQIINQSKYTERLEFYPVGNPVMMAFFNDVLNVEMEILFMGALGLMIVVLLLIFRSFSGVVWPISIVILASIWVVGMMGWLDVVMSMMFTLLVMLVLVVGVAYSVHIMSGYMLFRRSNQDHRTALRMVFKRSALACLLTGVTTSVGMLALIFVPIRPIVWFGVFSAIGVLLAFIMTVALLPLLLDIWQPISKKQADKIAKSEIKEPLVQKFLKLITPYALQYPWFWALLFLLVLVVSIYGVSKVQVDSNLVSIIKDGLPIKEAHILVDKVMGGTQSLEIFIDAKEQDALKDPRMLNAMEKAQNQLADRYKELVVKTDSLVQVVKNSYQALNEDREEMYIIPQDRPTLEQTLFLFDSANPDDRRLLVSDDYSRGRITIRLYNYGSLRYVSFFNEATKEIEEIFAPLKADYPALEVDFTGSLALVMKFADYIGWSQIKSFGLALGVISIMLFLVFGSLKAGLVAVIPNLLPIMVTFGVMGLLGISLDADTLIIAPIVIGIAVDDTIHFLTHYRAEYIEHGDITIAIKNSIREVGQAITFTSLILVIGFLILLISKHQGMANFGVLTAVAFFSALLADLLLLPSLCTLFKLRFSR